MLLKQLDNHMQKKKKKKQKKKKKINQELIPLK